MKKYLFLVLVAVSFNAIAGGIRGVVYGVDNEVLRFASIFVKNTGKGSSTNDAGRYELYLDPGIYTVTFQYLGYQTKELKITVGTQFITLDVYLEPIAYNLSSYTVKAGDEDPAYTIMRKAISKAKYHMNQLDSFNAQAYIKGSGRLIDAPKFIMRQIVEEGIDTSTSITMEVVMDIEFERPNTYRQHVISQRVSGNFEGVDPAEYVFSSFYEPDIVGVISPLSPKAFRYYKFLYIGSFRDKGVTVNKIRVIPRSKGEGVFWGTIFLVEDEWSIYSISLKSAQQGVDVWIKVDYGLIDEKVWLPVNHWLEAGGKIMGVEFEINYIATVDQYKIHINPDLARNFEVIDEKIDKQLAKEIELNSKRDELEGVEKLTKEQKVTRKDLRKMMKQYEKEELKREDAIDLLYNSSITVDSMATSYDSSYWDSVRTVPLNSYEAKGYKILDSISVAREEKADSTSKNKLDLTSIFTGSSYKLGENDDLNVKLIGAFNTVDGWNFGVDLKYVHETNNINHFDISGKLQYNISRVTFTGNLGLKYRFGYPYNHGNVRIEGGRWSSQFNPNNPIGIDENSFTTLFLEQNFVKLYQKDYLKAGFSKWIWPKINLAVDVSYEDRIELQNNSNALFIKWTSREYTSNVPVNDEVVTTRFPRHQIVLANLKIMWQPLVKFKIDNGVKRALRGASPSIWIKYYLGRGVDNVDSSPTTFDRLEVGVKHKWRTGARGILSYNIYTGAFLIQENLFFPDFAHFMGSRTPFTKVDPVARYRLLSYYNYSTAKSYASVLVDYEFRKFLLTQIMALRYLGIKEHLFINYLYTGTSHNYTEVGYTISNIFRVLKMEAAMSVNDLGDIDWGLRIGLSVDLKSALSGGR